MQKRRGTRRRRFPKSLKDIFLTKDQKETTKGEKFLLYQSKNNKLLVFRSAIGLEILSKSDHWGADGTFYTAAKYFYQLYVVSGYYEKRMIPCVWALMNRRRKKEYNVVLESVKKAAKKIKIKLSPKTVMMDFEKAAMNSFEEMFPGIIIKLCLFHFTQNIFRNLVNYGFKIAYSKEEKIKQWFKSFFVLSLVPLDKVDVLWEKILKEQPKLPNSF